MYNTKRAIAIGDATEDPTVLEDNNPVEPGKDTKAQARCELGQIDLVRIDCTSQTRLLQRKHKFPLVLLDLTSLFLYHRHSILSKQTRVCASSNVHSNQKKLKIPTCPKISVSFFYIAITILVPKQRHFFIFSQKKKMAWKVSSCHYYEQ